MHEDRFKHGAIGWTELITNDVDGAKKFYTELFGWETEEYPVEGINYSVIKVNGEEVGGIMKTPPDCQNMPPYWGSYITVDDVDATAKKVEELGGTILRPPSDIPTVGRFCVIQDPQGAVIYAITYEKR